MLFITRYFYLLLSIGALLVLPYVTKNLVATLEVHRKAESYLKVSQDLRNLKSVYQSRVKSVNRFRGQVDEFVKVARETHTTKSSWAPYQVDVDDVSMTLTHLQGLLEHARHGHTPQGTSFYFDPVKFAIRYLTKEDLDDLERKKDRAKITDIAKGKAKVSITLKGTFYVFQRQ